MIKTQESDQTLEIFYDSRDELHDGSIIQLDTNLCNVEFRKNGFKLNTYTSAIVNYDKNGLTWIEIKKPQDEY